MSWLALRSDVKIVGPGHVILAPFMAAAVAGSVTVLIFAVLVMMSNANESHKIVAFLELWPYAASFWLIGIWFPGGPIWMALHALRLRTAAAMGIAGAMVPNVILIGLSHGEVPPFLLITAISGAAAGLTMWYVAYRNREGTH